MSAYGLIVRNSRSRTQMFIVRSTPATLERLPKSTELRHSPTVTGRSVRRRLAHFRSTRAISGP